MAKKKIPANKKRAGKHQYRTILRSCRKIAETELPLVNNIIYNLDIDIPRWKELTKVQKAAFFFEYIVDESWVAITLRFSNEFMRNCASKEKITDFIRRRLNMNLKNRLGYVPEYLFCIEFEADGFHIHGVIKPNGNLETIRKVLKITAFGRDYTKNLLPDSCKLRCKQVYNAPGWGHYILKRCNKSKFDIYICGRLIAQIRKKYSDLLAKQFLIKLQLKRLKRYLKG